jgi:hypothetical protein
MNTSIKFGLNSSKNATQTWKEANFVKCQDVLLEIHRSFLITNYIFVFMKCNLWPTEQSILRWNHTCLCFLRNVDLSKTLGNGLFVLILIVCFRWHWTVWVILAPDLFGFFSLYRDQRERMIDWLIDWLFTVLRPVPLKIFSLIWRRHHYRWRAAKFRPMHGAQGHWAGRDLYRATPTVTRDLSFPGLIRMTAPPHSVTSTTRMGM